MRNLNLISIHFDGGCKPTNPGNKYGSFEVLHGGVSICKASRVEFGQGTNNEAEFNSLIAALQWTAEKLSVGGLEPGNYAVEMFTDSMIVQVRIANNNIEGKGDAAKRMGTLCKLAMNYLGQYRSHTIAWISRWKNEVRFGH